MKKGLKFSQMLSIMSYLPAYIRKASDAGDISPPIFWIFRQIQGFLGHFRSFQAILGNFRPFQAILGNFQAIFRPNFLPIFLPKKPSPPHNSFFSCMVWCKCGKCKFAPLPLFLDLQYFNEKYPCLGIFHGQKYLRAGFVIASQVLLCNL